MSMPNNGRPAPSCAFEEITPDQAKVWLGQNHRNRKLSDPMVHRLRGIIERGEWMSDSTDAIGLDTDEGVVNGQHRLTAIVESGLSVTALVARNVDPDVIKIIDQGQGRSFAQWLMMDGRYRNPTILANAVDWLYKMINGFEKSVPTAYRATVPQLLDLLQDHPNLDSSLDIASDAWSSVRVDRAMLTAYHYTMATVDDELADQFFEQLATGLDAQDGDPAYVLREKYLADSRKERGQRAQKYELAAWLVKAWEAARRNDSIAGRQLHWRTRGNRPEPFPRITGVPWLDELDASKSYAVNPVDRDDAQPTMFSPGD